MIKCSLLSTTMSDDVLGESNKQPEQPEQPEEKPKRSRLVIHQLALINFKSFAGTQVIGPFHKVSTRVCA